MRILLVNCYPHSERGDRKYRNFRENLLKILTEQNVNIEGKDYTLIERDKDHIEDHLFDLNSTFTRKEAANNFDIVDLVCIIGDTNLLPWQKAAGKAVILIKMCLRVKKWLFAVGFAMHTLIYLSASNLEKSIRVLNGNGHGSKLSDLANIDVSSPEFNPADHFLDYVTGDLYNYNPEYEEWVPVTNIGLHYERAAREPNTIGKYVVKSPVYNARLFDNPAQYNFDKINEKLCILKKFHYSHWLFEKVNQEFVFPWKMMWDVHSFSFLDPTKVFSILAETKTGPAIIEYHNIIAVQFEISKRYPDTVQIFRNFIASVVKNVMSNQPCQEGRQEISVFRYKEIEKKESGFQGYVFQKGGSIKEIKLKNLQFERKRGFKSNEGSPTHDSKQPRARSSITPNNFFTRNASVDTAPQKKFLHSGYASKSKGPQIVTQNVIANTRIHASKKIQNDGFYSTRLHELKEEFKQKCLYQKESADNPIELNINGPATHRPRIEHRTHSMPKFARSRPKSPNESLKQETRLSSMKASPNTSQVHSEVQLDQMFFKSNVRKALYPELDEQFIGEERLWVPGNLSKKNEEPKKNVVKLHNTLYASSIFSSKKKKQKNLDLKNPEENLVQPNLYLSAIEMARKHEQEEAKRILHGTFFYTSANKQSFNSSFKNSSNRNSQRPNIFQERKYSPVS